ncbi:hypothetical protein JUNP479_3077 [Aeromonas jandaei]|nr:hypothetical protein JUNP479_3077 [Aeromonas jandaei]
MLFGYDQSGDPCVGRYDMDVCLRAALTNCGVALYVSIPDRSLPNQAACWQCSVGIFPAAAGG